VLYQNFTSYRGPASASFFAETATLSPPYADRLILNPTSHSASQSAIATRSQELAPKRRTLTGKPSAALTVFVCQSLDDVGRNADHVHVRVHVDTGRVRVADGQGLVALARRARGMHGMERISWSIENACIEC
jgi:hypothetical protein